jgi:hypothetical protein
MPNRPERECVALIGDIVRSRSLDEDTRYEVQQQMSALLDGFNEQYRGSIISRFVVTLGDEFQGLLKAPQVIPDLLWQLENHLPDVKIRLGIGYGTLTTPVRDEALGMDGTSFHNARMAIIEAKSAGRLGGVFNGFGTPANEVLNGFARVLHLQRIGWTDTQREVVQWLRLGYRQNVISAELDITQQAVSSRVRSSGWEAYSEGESGWRVMLGHFDSTPEWEAA